MTITSVGQLLGRMLAILLLVSTPAHAETAVQAWVQRYSGPANGWNQANAVAVDGSNNVIVTGSSIGSGDSAGYLTIKYSSAGVSLWTNRYHGPSNTGDSATALAVDGSNDVIVTGSSVGIASGLDYATIKYSGAGEPLWTNRYNGPANHDDYAYAIAVDGSGNVIVTGRSASGTYSDYGTIMYSRDGLPLWTNRYRGAGSGNNLARAVAVDSSNNVVVTGGSYGSGSGYDYATLKYSSAGEPLWTNRYTEFVGAGDSAFAVAVDNSGNVIVTGYSIGGGLSEDYATIKYSSAGVPLWTNRYDGPGNGDDLANAVAVDGSGNVIVTGYSLGSGSSYDYATIKYSSDGMPLWTNRYNGPANREDYAYGVAVDGRGNVIVTGASSTGPYTYDYATIKYSSAGVPLWTNRYNGPVNSDDIATGVALDSSNNVIVTGYSDSKGGGNNYDFATIKYICVPEPVLTGLQVTNGAFQLRVDDELQPGTLVIEASTNLAGWAPVFTNTTPTNVVFYTEPDASNNAARFYRAYQFP
jgi:uncharacterized delta-60 repeat protein